MGMDDLEHVVQTYAKSFSGLVAIFLVFGSTLKAIEYRFLFALRYAYSLIQHNSLFLGHIQDTGDFITFAGYCDSLIWPMMAGGILISEISNAKAAYQRMETILSSKPDIVNRPGAVIRNHIQGHFVVSHLSFSYPDGKGEALKDISFEIQPGSKVGILGRTGRLIVRPSGTEPYIRITYECFSSSPDAIFDEIKKIFESE